MIKFFRKIRYNLMEKNKTAKYLKYAIGEIVLVVIGILIALQINNWNENSKAKSELKSDLSELKSELESDLTRLDSVLTQINSIDEQGNYLLEYLAQKPTAIDSSKVQKAITSVTFLARFGKSNTAYESLVNNGNFHLVENKNLKEKLGFFHNTSDWNETYHNGPLMESYNEYIKIIHNYTRPGYIRKAYEAGWPKKNEIIAKEIRINSFSSNIDFKKLNGSNDLLVLLDQVQLSRYIQKVYYSFIKDDIKELLSLIDYEINTINN